MTDRKSAAVRTGILVTGAAGGLGDQLVKQACGLPGIGAVVAADVRQEVMSRYADNPKVVPFVMDVASEGSIREVRIRLNDAGIRIRHLVNNAGTHAFFPVSESTEILLDRIVRVNVYGQVLTVSAFLDDLIEMKGRVVQVSSDSVRLPIPFYTYPASKAALEAFSVSMRRELQLHGVRLIMVRPGAMDTPFVDNMKEVRNEIAESRYASWFGKFVRMSDESVGKKSDPSEVAALIMRSLQAKRPRLVYSVNRNRKISFFSLFPERWKDRLIRKAVS